MLLFSTDDEEDEVMQTRTRKKHKKLDFSGEGFTDLLLFILCPTLSLRALLILSCVVHIQITVFLWGDAASVSKCPSHICMGASDWSVSQNV